MENTKTERSLGELFGDLSRETSQLVRNEVDLAKTEMLQKATNVGKDVGYLAVGGLVAYAGVLVLVAALVFGLIAAGLPAWASALIVGLIIAGIGYFFVQRGLSALERDNLVPNATIQTLKEDTEWAKRQVQS